METTEILTALGFVLLTTLTGTGCWVGICSLFPRYVERSSQKWCRPFLCFVLGLVGSGGLFAGGRMVAHRGFEAWIGQGLMGLYVVFGVIGMVGLAVRIGNGLKGGGTASANQVRGSVLLGLAAALPVIETAFFLKILLVGGVGNFLLSVVPGKSAPKVPSPRSGNRSSSPSDGEREGGNRNRRGNRRYRGGREKEGREARPKSATDSGRA